LREIDFLLKKFADRFNCIAFVETSYLNMMEGIWIKTNFFIFKWN